MHDGRLYARLYDAVTRVLTDTFTHDGPLYAVASLSNCDACALCAVLHAKHLGYTQCRCTENLVQLTGVA